MKNQLLVYSLLCVSTFINAQNIMVLDTIYANNHKNVALFFPQPIRQGITGAENFVFTYNREKEQYFGLLQAAPGTESNLLTITRDGRVYAYILKYADRLPKLNYFIPEAKSIGNEKPEIKIKNITKEIIDPYRDRTAYFERFSAYILKTKLEPLATKRKKGIRIQLQKVMYQANEVYLVIEIKNKSGIDFEVDYLNVYRTNGNNKRKASFQKLQQQVIHKYKIPHAIKNGERRRFVYVLPKMVLGNDEKLLLELQELNGSRAVSLKAKNL
ncbi:DUF4138 domain-containing protein [Wocania ichthyoenteri]|uniref:DUF4138 domain-containing protein n=1 Tax=Wocania ichthyoenteri TaxID=1230531 RepID=UPI00053DD134|nr:DUF4138 domain-containing protein [Wocania ichthyoenteri]